MLYCADFSLLLYLEVINGDFSSLNLSMKMLNDIEYFNRF